MELIMVDKRTIKDYISFCRKVYEGNLHYRDTMSVVLSSILNNKAEICKNSIIMPVMVLDEGGIVAVCIFSIVDRMKNILQLTFFESLENQQPAVDLLMKYAISLAKVNRINTISVGFNLHVNYLLGFLASKHEEVQSFGTAYTPLYYINYFKKYNPEVINFVNYLTDLKDFDFNIEKKVVEKITSKFHVRKANFNNMKKEAEIYTIVNNLAFKEHKFYYERRIKEDLELFNEFRYFIKEENLLFLEYKDKVIGFMLWYPDFNQLIKPGESLGIKTFFMNKIFGKRISKFKIVELGIIPKYQKSGAVMALFNKLSELTKGRFEQCETGWIIENNLSSIDLCRRWAHKEYKQYKVFLINI